MSVILQGKVFQKKFVWKLLDLIVFIFGEGKEMIVFFEVVDDVVDVVVDEEFLFFLSISFNE